MKGNVNFIHRRVLVNGKVHNKGGFTVAFKEVPEGVRYAYAYCSPKDNFDKAFGRTKASGRLESTNFSAVTYMTFEEFKESVYEEPLDTTL
jgi:hypothetical protein